MKYRNRLRVIRAERRITQLDAAVSSGMNKTRFWTIENGYAAPTDKERAAIAKALGVAESEAFPAEAIAS